MSRRYHRWTLWSGQLGSDYPITQKCVRCGLRRRVVRPHIWSGMYAGGRRVQQYLFKGARDWVRGRDGSLIFDHGGTPPCK